MCVWLRFSPLYIKGPNSMNAEEYMKLYEKYISGDCTPEEINQLYTYQDNYQLSDDHTNFSGEQQTGERILGKIKTSIKPVVSKKFSYQFFFKAAAVLLFTAGIGFTFYNWHSSKNKLNQAELAAQSHMPILPGKPSATLTLSDGSVIDLNHVQNGNINSKDPSRITKSDNGSISYFAGSKADSFSEAMNTLSVPRGGNFTVTLPDGTKVWLNAASSLTYPVSFNGKTRNVQLKGEAYFEVAKNKEKPFLVQAGNSQVTVLGTHFNIRAYENDRTVFATLLEGSVRFSNQSAKVLLVPGEQGVAGQDNGQIETRKVNTSQVVSWKNGYFMFQDNNISEIMDQISRWYNVDVEIKGDLSNKTFGGIYSRNKDINELLKGLELTDLVHFKIEGRKITVTP